MGEISAIGLDIAKSVFQIHGVDVDGAVVMPHRRSRIKNAFSRCVRSSTTWKWLPMTSRRTSGPGGVLLVIYWLGLTPLVETR
jgi:hypothetical protein